MDRSFIDFTNEGVSLKQLRAFMETVEDRPDDAVVLPHILSTDLGLSNFILRLASNSATTNEIAG